MKKNQLDMIKTGKKNQMDMIWIRSNFTVRQSYIERISKRLNRQ